MKAIKSRKETEKMFFASFVAMAIAVVVITWIVLFLHPPYQWTDPLNETKPLLADLVDWPGPLKHTAEVIFKPEDVLATSALVEGLPLSKDQICMSTGQFKEDKENGFECFGCEEGSDNPKIIYHGFSDQAARFAIVCNVNRTELLKNIEEYELEYETGTSIKAACEVCPEDGRCCAIILKRS